MSFVCLSNLRYSDRAGRFACRNGRAVPGHETLDHHDQQRHVVDHEAKLLGAQGDRKAADAGQSAQYEPPFVPVSQKMHPRQAEYKGQPIKAVIGEQGMQNGVETHNALI